MYRTFSDPLVFPVLGFKTSGIAVKSSDCGWMSKMEKYGNPLLPDDIFIEILLKLPLKYLIRCSCVSKRWRGLILSPQFSKIHFKLASEKKTLTPTLFVHTSWNYHLSDPTETRFKFQSVEVSGMRLLPVKNLTFPVEKRAQFEKRELQFMGSCNGLVILGQQNHEKLDQHFTKFYTNLSIWNPCTGFFLSLPDPLPTRLRYCIYINLGFGYVSSTDDYKIVLLRTVCCEPAGRYESSNWKQEVVIFSVRDNLWRSIEAHPYQPDDVLGSIDFYAAEQVAALSNETLHWLPICNYSIVAFDLAKEEFRKVSLPVKNKKRNEGEELGLLVLSSEQLCFWSKKIRRDRGFGYIEFWIMREYNVPESWSFLYKFDTQGFYRTLVPVFVAENGTVVVEDCPNKEFVEDCRNMELFTIDCHEQGRRRVKDQLKFELPGHHFGIFQFDQTLLSIGHGGDSTDNGSALMAK